jgi:hypothetical protein
MVNSTLFFLYVEPVAISFAATSSRSDAYEALCLGQPQAAAIACGRSPPGYSLRIILTQP